MPSSPPRGLHTSNPLPADCVRTFRFKRQIARGGFGVVYECDHLELDKAVAIKVLLTDTLDDPTALDRFRNEAKITASISHQNVVRVLDFGGSATEPWIAYELVRGPSLREVLSTRGSLDLATVVAIGIQTAEALHAAHSAGVLHRDIKPENVLCAEDGVYKITDFGIAKWTSQAAVHTRTGIILGTPTYVSPEQITGEPVTARSDIYALGIMLHELVTGSPPYMENVLVRLLQQHLGDPIPRPSETRPDLPPAFDRILARALAKRVADRYESALALRDDLAKLAQGLEDARPSGATAQRLERARPSGATARGLEGARPSRETVTIDSSKPQQPRGPAVPIAVLRHRGPLHFLGPVGLLAFLALMSILLFRPSAPRPRAPGTASSGTAELPPATPEEVQAYLSSPAHPADSTLREVEDAVAGWDRPAVPGPPVTDLEKKRAAFRQDAGRAGALRDRLQEQGPAWLEQVSRLMAAPLSVSQAGPIVSEMHRLYAACRIADASPVTTGFTRLRETTWPRSDRWFDRLLAARMFGTDGDVLRQANELLAAGSRLERALPREQGGAAPELELKVWLAFQDELVDGLKRAPRRGKDVAIAVASAEDWVKLHAPEAAARWLEAFRARNKRWMKSLPSHPPQRDESAMAQDPLDGSAFLFGGTSFGVEAEAGWSWDGRRWKAMVAERAPPGRCKHAMALDPRRKRVVLFGGQATGYTTGRFADTWEWDGVNWIEIKPPRSPSARAVHAMAYDPDSGRVLLFGGEDDNSRILADTWAWDGANWSELRSPVVPPARNSSTMVTWVPGGTVLLHGGVSPGKGMVTDTWEWRKSGWSRKPVVHEPVHTNWPRAVYCADRREVVLFAGQEEPPTWTFDGKDWKPLLSRDSPTTKGGFAIAYDEPHKQVVLVTSPEVKDPTWVLEGEHWNPIR